MMEHHMEEGKEKRTSLPPRPEHDQILRKSINLIVGLLRFRDSSPSVDSALGRATDRGGTIFDIAAETGADGLISLTSWCAQFIETIQRGLGQSGSFTFRRDIVARVPFETAQCLALALGEFIVDALERAFYAGQAPQIKVSLENEGSGRLALRIVDGHPSFRIPPLAQSLADSMNAELRNIEGEQSTERTIFFHNLS
jgi:hypothetical protein